MYESSDSHESIATMLISTRTRECEGRPDTVLDAVPAPPNRAGPPSTFPRDPHDPTVAPVHPSSSTAKEVVSVGKKRRGQGEVEGVADAVAVGLGVWVGEAVRDGVTVGVGVWDVVVVGV